ncbi:MAG: hypothetical protein V1933_05585 [Candidatus Omnitrophota bacterium]
MAEFDPAPSKIKCITYKAESDARKREIGIKNSGPEISVLKTRIRESLR